MNVKVLVLCLLLPWPVLAQGFAGLGATAEGFETPRRGYKLSFPADHGAHPSFRIEWWYVTATLSGEDGRDYGIQWTLFRTALKPREADGWQSPQLWLGHAAVTTPDAHMFAERRSRGGIGQAGVIADPFSAWIDDWQMAGPNLDTLSLFARGARFAYDLTLEAKGPLILHGENGVSTKSASGQVSFYYSQPAYAASGILKLPDGEIAVTGQAWLDREWSSQPLADDQSGWDWFSLSFDSGDKLMAFRLRSKNGDFTAATWISPNGSSTFLPDGSLSARPLQNSQVAGRTIPTGWNLQLEKQGLDVQVTALNPSSWMGTSFPYWEGPVYVTGSHTGRGYLEMTGYK